MAAFRLRKVKSRKVIGCLDMLAREKEEENDSSLRWLVR